VIATIWSLRFDRNKGPRGGQHIAVPRFTLLIPHGRSPKADLETPITAKFASDRTCGVVATATAAEAIRQIKLAVGPQGCLRNVELRLDYLRNAAERVALLEWLAKKAGGEGSHSVSLPVLIATCRTRRGGGKFGGSVAAELAILAQAARAGCAWCDVEIETAEQFDPAELRDAIAPGRLMVSAHDFRRLPPKLPALAKRLDRFGGDAIKIAADVRFAGEARRLFQLTRGRGDVVAIPMGERMLAARMLALREGSALAYVPIAVSTAPGQLSLDALQRVYRWQRRFGAVGPGADAPYENLRRDRRSGGAFACRR
jgi:3-dehydroquinate dehydratase type I